MTIHVEIENCKKNKYKLLQLTASKFTETITRERLSKEQPDLYFELLRFGNIDYSISNINFDIVCSNRK